jgi:PPK2 family polyphosphate:nucleotide phosphotransferase
MLGDDVLKTIRVPPGERVRLKDHDTGWALTDDLKTVKKDDVKERARELLGRDLAELAKAQDLLYASQSHGVLVVLQGMDASGKDSTIKHVMSGLNPQGCEVHSFKKPSPEELAHTFLWRYTKALPARGRIGIFNRSQYEDVLVVRVHPELLGPHVPAGKKGKSFWEHRYDDINALERHVTRNGTLVLKFFLHIAKDEQKKRFLARLDDPTKQWKFSASDLAARAYWDDYMKVYEDALSATSTEWAPWYVVPADHKWVSRTVVADVLATSIRELDLKVPELTPGQRAALAKAREQLEREQARGQPYRPRRAVRSGE